MTAGHASDSLTATAGPLVLLAGGGSGGHVFPALAVGEELVRRGWRMSATGSLGGMEARLYADRGVAFHGLPARPVVGRGPLDRLRALVTLAGSARRAARLIRELDVAAVVATGGYAAAPAMLGARLTHRPLLLVEPNARAGAANRWLSPLCTEAAVAHGATARELRCPATVTGVPVRAAFTAVPSALPPAPPWRLLVLGGSQGAQTLNRTLPAAIVALAAKLRQPIAIVHQAGEHHLAPAQEAWAQALGNAAANGVVDLDVQVAPFLADVAGAMAASHLVISRAGAITLAEICAAGRPSLLLPLALAGGHQVANAEALAATGAARLLRAEEVESRLAAVLGELVGDADTLARMAGNARAAAHPDATARIADRVEAITGRARGRVRP